MNKFITVKSTLSQADIIVAKSYLEDNGIECFLRNEYFSQVHPFVAAGQGVELQVVEANVEKAVELLISGGFASKDDYDGYSDWFTRLVAKVMLSLKGEG